MLSNESLQKLVELADKIALELVFAEPGKDAGLLPINNILGEIESIVSAGGGAEGPLLEPAVMARQSVDTALANGGFDAASLQLLGSWACWMREAATALESGVNPPAPPAMKAGTRDVQAEAAPDAAAPAAPDQQSFTVDSSGNLDLLREFVEESNEHLHRIEQDALTLERAPADADALNSIFRSFHTLKGGSGFLNLTPVNRLAHQLEALLDLARQNKLVANRQVIDVILHGRDWLRQFVVELEKRLRGETSWAAAIPVATRDLLAQIEAAKNGGPVPADNPDSAKPGTPGSPPAPERESKPDAVGGAPVQTNAGPTSSGSVKVDTLKLDSMIDLVGELVIAQSLVVEDAGMRSADSQQLARNLVHLRRVTNDLQRVAMSLRMIPIRTTFQKMARLVRDVASKAGKTVDLRISGEDTELDRNLIEGINDPLIHMLRNAVDHGIEKPADRKARGKAETGTIHLRAFHQGGNVVIEIEDDGAGLNKERILNKAIAKGLVSKDATLSEQEIFGLVFAPGFSTAETVTEISGRGVGMDVVQKNIAKLRGKVEIQSTEGKGSRFAIHLPLTLAIIDGLIFSVGHERFIVPTLTVCESFRPQPGMISTVQGRGEIVSVRGQFNPVVRLYERFGIQPETTDPAESIIVVVQTNRQRLGLLVDKLLGKQEVVIKGLGDVLRQNGMLAGAAILGDGRVGLILDVNGLMRGGESSVARN